MKACGTSAPERRFLMTAVAAACALVEPALAAPQYPPRRAEIFAPPAVVELSRLNFAEPRDPLAPPLAVDVTTAIAWLDSRPNAVPPDRDTVDFAWSLLDDSRRELALAVDDWAAQRGLSADRRRLRTALADAYKARGFAPFWIEAGQWRETVTPAVARLAKAGDDALDLRAYAMPSAEKAAPTAQDELTLSEAVAAYALQARGSRIEPERLSHLIGAKTDLPDPARAVAEVANAEERAGDVMQEFNPPHYGYQQLREKLVEMRAQNAVAPAADQLLAVATDPVSDAPPPGRGKRRRADAVAPSMSRVEADIIANMERWRWLPRDLGDPRIEVNIPDFELALVRNGQVAHRTRVIVGKEKTPTPIFSDEMEEIIVNPSWYVPQSIIQKEWGGNVGKGYQVSTRRGQMVVRQPPGERNALGRVKFVFPNDFAVYMHDTPTRGLFSETHRAFSHGCMRVQEPFALAEAVLGPGSGWSEARVKRMIGPSERYINLEKKMPVHIEYFTAYVDEAGQLVQRPDLYGYSARVRRALGLGG